MNKKKVLLLELNEFNLDLLKKCADITQAKNIQKILSFDSMIVKTEDTYDSDYLEPWVQWVSVHTGVDSKKHQIKHLGDVPHLDVLQLWQALNEKDITTAVWGAMNASKGESSNQLFFLPDPWTFSEIAYPDEINSLLNPLRYLCKNYLQKSKFQVFKELKDLILLFKRKKLLVPFAKTIFQMIFYSFKFPKQHFPLICQLEKLSVLLFLDYKKQFQPEFSILFVNSLAHLQHHHWKDFDYENNSKLLFGVKTVDEIIGLLLKELEDGDIFLISNGLSQKNTTEEDPWILYRQYDQTKFLKSIGVRCSSVEEHMTHDAHIFFDNEADRDEALKILNSAEIQGKKLFEVETYTDHTDKIFYKIIFTDELEPNTVFSIGDLKFDFFDFFKKVVKRTGKHIPESILLSSEKLNKQMTYNHEIYSHILHLFGVEI